MLRISKPLFRPYSPNGGARYSNRWLHKALLVQSLKVAVDFVLLVVLPFLSQHPDRGLDHLHDGPLLLAWHASVGEDIGIYVEHRQPHILLVRRDGEIVDIAADNCEDLALEFLGERLPVFGGHFLLRLRTELN